MSVYVCSLKTDAPQTIAPGGDYQLVRFPFGSSEPYDAFKMHDMAQPDGYQIASVDEDRSGLIWPAVDGWATLTGMLYWSDGAYSEVRDRFVRDPLNLSTGYDSTATEDHAITPGGQYLHKTHQIFVHPSTPVGLLVRHTADAPVDLMFAEFKMAIHSDTATPS